MFIFFAVRAASFLVFCLAQSLLIGDWFRSFALFCRLVRPFSESTSHPLCDANKHLRADRWSGNVLLMHNIYTYIIHIMGARSYPPFHVYI